MSDVMLPEQIQDESFNISQLGLVIKGEPTIEEWVEFGKQISKTNKLLHFVLGDWLNYGSIKYGETYKKFVEQTGFSLSTLRHDKWVTGQIPLERRRQELTFSHHEIVAPLELEEQDELLDKAVTDNLSCRDLERLIKPVESCPRGQNQQSSSAPSTPRENGEGEVIEGSESPEAFPQSVSVATTIKDQCAVLQANLEECNLEELPEPVRNEILKSLVSLRDKITALEIKYGE